MKVPILLPFLLCCVSLEAQGQFSVRLVPGVGTYQLSTLRDFHNQLSQDGAYPVPLTTTDLFPDLPNLEISFLKHKEAEKLVFGLTISMGQTGARSGYRDYSGSLSLDERVRFVGLLANVAVKIGKEDGPWRFILDFRPGVLLNRLDISESIVLGNNASTTSLSFNSLNVVAQPTLGVSRVLGRFFLYAQGGYQFTLDAGKLSLDEQSGAYLTGTGGKEVTADWSGIRLGLGVGYQFSFGK